MKPNKSQSIKDKLKNLAKAAGREYNFVCIQFMQERFLARLEKSDYQQHFILKGALLLLAYDFTQLRPTKDIDLLGNHIANDEEEIKSAISQIATIDLNDGVVFNGDQIEIDRITKNAEYTGLRVKLGAAVGGDQHRLQIDIGFGDVIAHGPVKISYPAMLAFSAPQIMAYSLESAIAEKLQAIVSLGLFGSRMKDFYDIWFLTKNRSFDNARLTNAIELTFRKRNTDLKDISLIFKQEFIQDSHKATQWKAFLRRTSIEQDISFESIMQDLKRYFERGLTHQL